VDIEIHIIDTFCVREIVSVTGLLHARGNVFPNGVVNLFRRSARRWWVVSGALRHAASELFWFPIFGATRQWRDQSERDREPAQNTRLRHAR
jgi:hypothetical protein